jgi:PhzF family phenazine biosynthesis protein
MSHPIHVVDAFTDQAFRGNPAAVCWLEAPADAEWLQAVAAEMKHSETAFVTPLAEGFALRWFTPSMEVPLCGHATLASAHVLYHSGRLAAAQVARFHTASGVLEARRQEDWITLDFPAIPSREGALPESLARALRVQPVRVAQIDFNQAGGPTWIVELADEPAVLAASPDFRDPDWEGDSVILTAPGAADGVDFVSRFFAPGAGIDEDPVTGFAHCCLAPYWSPRLGATDLLARQLSARGGTVRVGLGDGRVALRGQAVSVLDGTLRC